MARKTAAELLAEVDAEDEAASEPAWMRESKKKQDAARRPYMVEQAKDESEAYLNPSMADQAKAFGVTAVDTFAPHWDEAAGAIAGFAKDPNPFSAQQRAAYTKGTADARAVIDEAQDIAPGASAVGMGAGMAAGLVGGVGTGAAKSGLALAKQGLKTGAAVGGTSGFFGGRGLEGSVEGGATGAALGGALGALPGTAGAAASGARKVASMAKEAMARMDPAQMAKLKGNAVGMIPVVGGPLKRGMDIKAMLKEAMAPKPATSSPVPEVSVVGTRPETSADIAALQSLRERSARSDGSDSWMVTADQMRSGQELPTTRAPTSGAAPATATAEQLAATAPGRRRPTVEALKEKLEPAAQEASEVASPMASEAAEPHADVRAALEAKIGAPSVAQELAKSNWDRAGSPASSGGPKGRLRAAEPFKDATAATPKPGADGASLLAQFEKIADPAGAQMWLSTLGNAERSALIQAFNSKNAQWMQGGTGLPATQNQRKTGK